MVNTVSILRSSTSVTVPSPPPDETEEEKKPAGSPPLNFNSDELLGPAESDKHDIPEKLAHAPADNFSNGYALIVGIANYPKVRRLPVTVVKDAQDVAKLIQAPEYCGYLNANVRLLLDGKATADDIREGLRWLASSADIDATVLIFFSGHGGRAEGDTGAGNYLIPFDCDPHNLDATALSGKELTELLHNIQARRLLVLFDCCYSGGAGEAKDLGPSRINFKNGLGDEYYERLAQGKGRVIMASSRTDEISLVLGDMDNSLFTYYLLEGLKGKARTRSDGLIRVFDLFDYVSEQVPARASQHPIFKASDLETNFPIALYTGGKKVAAGEPATLLSPTHVGRRELREAVVAHFTMDDLELLCEEIEDDLKKDGVQLQVDLGIFGTGGRDVVVRRLIEYLENRGYLSYLVSAVRRVRSGII